MAFGKTEAMKRNDIFSSISLYVGIPTQEYRTIQGNLTRLVGNVLRLAYQCDESRPDDPSYQPLLEGASAYVSVFGHYVSDRGSGGRMDDHTEVIEFITIPEDYRPALLLILCEIAYPALLLADQEAVLMLVVHEGTNARVVLMRQEAVVMGSGGGAKAKPRRNFQQGAEYKDYPQRRLRVLLHNLITCHWPNKSERATFPYWLQKENKDGVPVLNERAEEEWSNWLLNGRGRAPYRKEGSPRTYLPTIYVRSLLNVACWWLFYSVSRPVREMDPEVWEEETMKTIVRLLKAELGELKVRYDDQAEQNVETEEFRLDTDDPLPNATLWLAFVHDFIANCLVYNGAPVASRISEFDELLPVKYRRLLNRKGAVSRVEDWTKRLDLLEKANDKYFPDDDLHSAWRLFFDLVAKPEINIVIRGNAAKGRLTRGIVPMGEENGGAGAPTQPQAQGDESLGWNLWVCGKGPQTLDRWVRLARRRKESPAVARLWTAPLMVEAVYALHKSQGSKPAKRPKDPKAKHGLGIVRRMAVDAAVGYPYEIKPGSDAPGIVGFIKELQESRKRE